MENALELVPNVKVWGEPEPMSLARDILEWLERARDQLPLYLDEFEKLFEKELGKKYGVEIGLSLFYSGLRTRGNLEIVAGKARAGYIIARTRHGETITYMLTNLVYVALANGDRILAYYGDIIYMGTETKTK
jgi:hypothetical protein